jgi:lipoprotein-releasing system permease protein
MGLMISAFALVVLQSTMGGLQGMLVGRSKAVHGQGFIELRGPIELRYKELAQSISEKLSARSFMAIPEYEIELLVKQGQFVAPLILRGIDLSFGVPPFFDRELSSLDNPAALNLVLGLDLAYKLRLSRGVEARLMGPAHTSVIGLAEVPRFATVTIEKNLRTDVPEVDAHMGWTRLSLVQNLVRQRGANRIRFYGEYTPREIDRVLHSLYTNELQAGELKFVRWEDQHQTLVWALNLETTVMVFLFVAMTLLVALCITSGLMLFFDKLKQDLASFWILGASRRSLDRASGLFLVLLSFLSTVTGLVLGLGALYVLHHFGGELMPEGFVDRKIPVKVDQWAVLVSFLVPFSISLVFSYTTLSHFKRENDFLEVVRSVG